MSTTFKRNRDTINLQQTSGVSPPEERVKKDRNSMNKKTNRQPHNKRVTLKNRAEPAYRTTIIEPLDDATLVDLLSCVKRDPDGYLPWDVLVAPVETKYHRFAARLKRLGIKTRPTGDGDGHWMWKNPNADNGTRPEYKRRGYRFLAYRGLLAAFLEQPITTEDGDVHHWCKVPLCVRPGTGHCVPLTKVGHWELEKYLSDNERFGKAMEEGKDANASIPVPPKNWKVIGDE